MLVRHLNFMTTMRPLKVAARYQGAKDCCWYTMKVLCVLQATVNVEGGGSEGYLLRSTASTVSFPGYLAVYPPKISAGLIFSCTCCHHSWPQRKTQHYYCQIVSVIQGVMQNLC